MKRRADQLLVARGLVASRARAQSEIAAGHVTSAGAVIEKPSSLLEDAGVAVIGGPDFGILGEGYMRLSYANSTENILKALDRMGDFLTTRNAA